MDKINLQDINKAISIQDQEVLSDALKSQKSSGSENAKQQRVMGKLWNRLLEIYGHQLASQYGETMPDSWERLLTGISPDQIKAGLERLATRKDSWPPNAVEFRKLCLPETISPDGHNSKAYLDFNDPNHPDYKPKMLESDQDKARRKKTASNELDRLKGLF